MNDWKLFMYKKDLLYAIDNGDQKHVVMAMRELVKIGYALPPDLMLKLCDFIDPDRPPVKAGSKKNLLYWCDNDPSQWKWFNVAQDYEYLCKEENKEIARFVVHCDVVDLPINEQDLSSWNLGSYRNKKFPLRGDIKIRLCKLYNVSARTFDTYCSAGKNDESIDDFIRLNDDGVPWEVMQRNAAKFSHDMVKLREKGFSKEQALAIIIGKHKLPK